MNVKMQELLNDCVEISKLENEITQKSMFETVLKNAYFVGFTACRDNETERQE